MLFYFGEGIAIYHFSGVAEYHLFAVLFITVRNSPFGRVTIIFPLEI